MAAADVLLPDHLVMCVLGGGYHWNELIAPTSRCSRSSCGSGSCRAGTSSDVLKSFGSISGSRSTGMPPAMHRDARPLHGERGYVAVSGRSPPSGGHRLSAGTRRSRRRSPPAPTTRTIACPRHRPMAGDHTNGNLAESSPGTSDLSFASTLPRGCSAVTRATVRSPWSPSRRLVLAAASAASRAPAAVARHAVGCSRSDPLHRPAAAASAPEQIYRIQPSGNGPQAAHEGRLPGRGPGVLARRQAGRVRARRLRHLQHERRRIGVRTLTRNARDSFPRGRPTARRSPSSGRSGRAWKVFVMSATGAG